MVNQINQLNGKKAVKNYIKTSGTNTSFIIKKKRFGLHLSAVFLFMLIAVCTSCSKEQKDKEIKADLAAKAKDQLSFAAVNYTVDGGVVTLTGKCSSEKSKGEVEETVKGINIINGIINKIVVAPVVLNKDLPMKQSVDSVLKDYPSLQANVSGDTIMLDGKAKKQELSKLMPALNKLHPTKIDNRLQMQ